MSELEDDLVRRLRNADIGVCDDAAREIVALREALADLVDTFGAVVVTARVPEDRDAMVAVFAAFRKAMDALGGAG